MRSRYDVIVVGGGTAGCIVASNLVELKSRRVLLVEAGGWPSGKRLHVPALYTDSLMSHRDWSYKTSPQASMAGQSLHYPRGKVLGGSGMINAMIYTRGSRWDFDSWVEAGLRDWSLAACLPAFEKIERKLFSRSDDIPNLEFEASRNFLQGARDLGWTFQSSLVQGDLQGVGIYRTNTCRGRRRSTWHAYLKQRAEEGRLDLSLGSTVEKILFEGDRACGLSVRTHHGSEEILADEAIVICSGALHSPAILMKSGIGGKEHLCLNGIDVRIDSSEVGANLQDHLLFPLIYSAPEQHVASKPFSRAARREYTQDRRGPLSSNLSEVGGFGRIGSGCCRSEESSFPPDYQIHVTPNHYFEFARRSNPTPALSIGITWLRPRSRGSIRLRSDSTSVVDLDLDPAYFSEREDLDSLVAAVQEVRPIGQSSTFIEAGYQEIFPGWERDRVERVVQRMSTTLFHPVGTCRMGVDGGSVVDPHLRVRGCSGLFVADASIMPFLPRGNTQAVTMMIAERLTELNLH